MTRVWQKLPWAKNTLSSSFSEIFFTDDFSRWSNLHASQCPFNTEINSNIPIDRPLHILCVEVSLSLPKKLFFHDYYSRLCVTCLYSIQVYTYLYRKLCYRIFYVAHRWVNITDLAWTNKICYLAYHKDTYEWFVRNELATNVRFI